MCLFIIPSSVGSHVSNRFRVAVPIVGLIRGRIVYAGFLFHLSDDYELFSGIFPLLPTVRCQASIYMCEILWEY